MNEILHMEASIKAYILGLLTWWRTRSSFISSPFLNPQFLTIHSIDPIPPFQLNFLLPSWITITFSPLSSFAILVFQNFSYFLRTFRKQLSRQTQIFRPWLGHRIDSTSKKLRTTLWTNRFQTRKRKWFEREDEEKGRVDG